jgi:hypothetical protein
MATEFDERQLLDAEVRLHRALQRLSTVRRAALYGKWDAAEFEEAMAAYRAAEADVVLARRNVARERDAALALGTEAPANAVQTAPAPPSAPTEVTPTPAPAPPPLPITPRLEFARWLVRTGRLSEWGAD